MGFISSDTRKYISIANQEIRDFYLIIEKNTGKSSERLIFRDVGGLRISFKNSKTLVSCKWDQGGLPRDYLGDIIL